MHCVSKLLVIFYCSHQSQVNYQERNAGSSWITSSQECSRLCILISGVKPFPILFAILRFATSAIFFPKKSNQMHIPSITVRIHKVSPFFLGGGRG